MKKDPRIDAYVARARPFARPILEHLRALVHRGCPGAEETIKWGMPFFLHRGKILASFAAFKAHAAFTLWHGRVLVQTGYLPKAKTSAMGQLGQVTTIGDLPSAAVLLKALKRSMALIEGGEPGPIARRASRPELPLPADLARALAANGKAKAAFAAFPPGHRREYIQWITEAKRPETRAKRIATAIPSITRGRSQNWRYQR